ncbi:MAG TPA: M13-type metalloendopeptidase [Caulobacteraceae bacterium]|jgi:putative endopeptidase
MTIASRFAVCLLAFACTAPLAASAVAQSADAAPSYGTWGFDLSGRDLSVKPGDDFNAYASGSYLKTLKIPTDQARWGAFNLLRDLSDARVRAILEAAAAAAPQAPTTDEGKIGAFYKAYMDVAAVDAKGVAPLQADLDAIRHAQDRDALAAFLGRTNGGFGSSLFNISVSVDLKTPTAYIATISQDGLGLPDRDYYLDPKFAAKKAAYQAYVQRMLELIGWPGATTRAADVVAFETAVAQASWPRADRRDRNKTYNPTTVEALAAAAPGFDWQAFLRGANLGALSQVNVAENTAAPKIAAVFSQTPLDTLKAWAAFQVADDAADVLPDAFVQAHFDFRGKTLSGTPELKPRWKRAGDLVGSLHQGMGDAVGKDYVARYFPPSSKAKMEALVQNLRASFRARIERNDWMSPQTKAAALEKLANYKIMVGYTTEWRDYSGLEIRSDDLYGDAERARAADWAFERSLLGRPVDRNIWNMTPQTVNAYNAGPLVEVVFPAAILQPPFFDPKADMAINYGGIGSVIGHEMTHGFDDQGRKIDATGHLRDWWTADDAAKFDAKAARYGAEFAAYDTGLGVSINPKLTMGENIADLGGLNLALDAYHASLDGRPAPAVGGYSGDQRVFLGWAQVWRELERPDSERQALVTDPHSPGHYRAITAERNMDAWYKAFDVHPGEKLYIAPQDRVTIW